MRDASFERGKRRTRRRTPEARPRREHWSREYAIYAEDSWGIDDLGPEGGENLSLIHISEPTRQVR